MEEFRKLGIIEPILKVIEDEKFEKPSTIQEKSIPIVLAGKDVVALSSTGSGKTLAFGSGIIQYVNTGQGIQSLVLAPTRELAEQVAKDLKKFSKYKPLKIVTVYGGVSINPQIQGLMTADIVVGTPGRILDHLERRPIDLRKVKILVLDEADRMFDMGFIDDVERIIKNCPKERQTLLFSATMSDQVYNLAKRHMQEASKVSAEEYVDPKKLKQVYYDISDNQKFSLLVHLLKHEKAKLVMVFCNSRRTVDFVVNNLKPAGIQAKAIHGGLSQDKRTRVIEGFHSHAVEVMVCTDVAARGLHIEGVSHVYNYDIPKESKQYIHRIGRTARAGKEGIAINLLASRDHGSFTRLIKDNSMEIGKDIIKEATPTIEKAKVTWVEGRSEERGRGYGRDSRSRPPQRRGRF